MFGVILRHYKCRCVNFSLEIASEKYKSKGLNSGELAGPSLLKEWKIFDKMFVTLVQVTTPLKRIT